MGRPPTDPDKKLLGFNVRLSPAQLAFLEEQKAKLDVPYAADVVRDLVEAFRTSFSLPAYQVELLKKDRESRKLTWIAYVQELLARRYEHLNQEQQSKARGK